MCSTVSYESVSQCLTIVGLRAHHLRELETFLAGVRTQKLTLRTPEGNQHPQRTPLGKMVAERSWLPVMGQRTRQIIRLSGIYFLALENLWMSDVSNFSNFDPGHVPTPRVQQFSATGFATMSSTLSELIAITA
ncbi:hypothetical protein KCU78_g3048, partial [Aureobasidium melanogenum]